MSKRTVQGATGYRAARVGQKVQMPQIPREITEIINRGRKFEDLIRQPAWTDLLDQISAEVDKKLKAMRLCRSNDPKIQSAMMNSWRMWEEAFQRFQEMALGPIKAKLEAEEEIRTIIGQGIREESVGRKENIEEGSADSGWDFEDDIFK